MPRAMRMRRKTSTTATCRFSATNSSSGLGLALRKHILMRRGAIADAGLRAPGPKLSAADIAEMDRLIARTERKVAALKG